MIIEDIGIGRYVLVTTPRIPWAYFCRGYIAGGDKVAGTIQVFIEKDTDCEFYTFFVEEVELATEEPLYAPVEDCMQSMVPADLSSIKHLRPPAPRPLSSLTEEEARECYRLATFDDDESITVEREGNDLYIEGVNCRLVIYSEREMKVSERGSRDGYAASINAVAFIRYLDSLGIVLGE